MHFDERTDDVATHRRNAGEPAHSRALEETHQHGLGLIVGGVTQRDPMGRDAGGGRLERRVPGFARRCLERAVGIDRHGHDVDGSAKASPEPADEVGVGG
jgi:hypothetical protein